MAGRFRRLGLAPLLGPLALCFGFVASAAGQSPPSLSVQKIPAGQRPMGIGLTPPKVSGERLAVVANSGENSVSVFSIKQDLSRNGFVTATPSKVISGTPSPFDLISCYVAGALMYVVTSPSDNSISFVDVDKGTVIAKVKVGSRPYSASCFVPALSELKPYAGVFVSNYGDNSLSVVDVNSFTVTRTIPNVPGSRGLSGIVAIADQVTLYHAVWVAGTDANVVTVLNPFNGAIAASIPVRAPTFLSHWYYPYGTANAFWVGSSLDNAMYSLDASDFHVGLKISDVPTPQDFTLDSGFRWLATTGPGNSVVRVDYSSAAVPFVTGIPGAAGITGGSFFNRPFALVTSPDSNSVFLIQFPPDSPSQFSVAGASFGGAGTAPGGLASAFATTGVIQSFFASLPLPKTLGGVSLRLGGSLTLDSTNATWNYSLVGSADAPLLFVGPSQINFQVPPGISPSTTTVNPAQLTRPDGSTLLTTVAFAATNPGVFTFLHNGAGQAAALNQDNTVNFGTNPAKRGSVIQIFATGAGETIPPLAGGEAAPSSGNPLVLTKVQPTVTIGGKNAPVQFSGMAPGFVGLWQINAQIPQDVTPGMTVPLVITAGGAASNTVTIAVQ